MAKNEFGELMSVGIDIGKDVFHLVGFDHEGQFVLRKKIKRMALITTFEELPHCIVGMEACLSAHFVRLGTHNQNMTVAARAIADGNTLGHRS